MLIANFATADTDKNGKLSKGEFLQYLSEKNGGSDQPDGKFDGILTDFKKIDGKNRTKKRNGQIERTEFSAYELEKFNEADKDHNGKLSQEELKTLDPNADFSKYDKNTDKQIDKREFNKYVNDRFNEIDKLGKKDNRITVGEWIAHRIDHAPPPPPPLPPPSPPSPSDHQILEEHGIGRRYVLQVQDTAYDFLTGQTSGDLLKQQMVWLTGIIPVDYAGRPTKAYTALINNMNKSFAETTQDHVWSFEDAEHLIAEALRATAPYRNR